MMKKTDPNVLPVWIDICHPPQAVFFTPVIEELHRRGVRTLITVRENFESSAILERTGFRHTVVGRHYGRRLGCKVLGLLVRVTKLLVFMRGKACGVGVSHGSPYLKIVCFLKRIPCVAIGDNEHSRGLLLALAQKILVPEAMPGKALNVRQEKIVHYPGLKEEVYIGESPAHEDLRGRLQIDDRTIMVTVRPPARFANYHNPESDVLFDRIMETLVQREDVVTVLLPRSEGEKTSYRTQYGGKGNVRIPDEVLKGLDLLLSSDLVLSGGGTMIREAAVLGVPAYSFFRGRTLAVDRYLVDLGRLKLIRSVEDIGDIRVEKRSRPVDILTTGRDVKAFLVDEILSLTGPRRREDRRS